MAYGDRKRRILAMLETGQTAVEVAAALGVTANYVYIVAAKDREEHAAVEAVDHPRRLAKPRRCPNPNCRVWMTHVGPSGDCWACHVRRQKCGLCSAEESAIGGG